ncbi:uncharacterized protein LTR77_002494 [Saxophila tyrrhenica]|uniref:FAD-binding PCMH-type domain-containing protein n=1 Tax=Saxophila tyrrhenica TaxID=1690608 RepID=A0AAV9PNI9_9PEZI|nr:hypothetical protein LTR77_002494 [Saxophila tyrrhenica]
MGSMADTKRLVTADDIDRLRQLLSDTDAEVRGPSDTGYDKSIDRWSKAAEKPAGLAIAPASAQDVAIAVKYAAENGLDLAVKGGGHSTAGASSTDGGILIDLQSKMRKVTVDTEKNLLHVQGGALWSDVDEAAWNHGLATVGGTVADTGIGGLTLGGGYGVLSGAHGLVIDNTVSFETVLANGEVKRSSKEENADLFWALNGAGQNFGVTTEFVFQAHPQDKIYMGTMLFPAEAISKLVAALNELYKVNETPQGPQTKSLGRAMSLVGFAKPPPAEGKTMVLMNAVFDGPEEEGKKMFQPFFDIGPAVNEMRMDAYPNANKLVPAMYGMRSSMKGAAHMMPLREQFVHDIKTAYDGFIDTCPDAALSVVAWELYDPVKVAASDEGSFANRGYHFNSLVMPMWSKAENDAQCRQFARDLSNMFKKEISEHGAKASGGIEGGASVRGRKGAVLLYGNYDQYDEISKDVYGDNYPRLQKIKAQYDPKNMFNKLFAIQPEGASAQL